MTEVLAIQFTQEQARTLTGVSPETLRHWRKAVPYLAAKSGKSARFTFSDVVGLAVTREVITSFGVQIRSVSVGVNALFQLLAETQPNLLENAVAVVTTSEASLSAAEDVVVRSLDCPALVVPIDPLVVRIQRHLLPTAAGAMQATLPFPPHAVRSGT